MAESATTSSDVLIVGAGPAGTSAAALLAEQGHDVVILDRDEFPRYRVGESLIPFCWYPLTRLGLVKALDESAFIVPKYSVQFVTPDGRQSMPFYFQQHRDHESSRTWQVVRSEFDELLLDNALKKGARMVSSAAAQDVIEADGWVKGVRATVRSKEQEFRAQLTIDASGRDTFAQRVFRWRVPDRHLRKVAIWTYYRGAGRDPGIDEGATTIAYVPEKGWFWYLPLSQDLVSVGIVAERDYLYRESNDPEEIFEREAERQPWIRERLEIGEKVRPCQVTGDYTYRSRHCARDGIVLAGDAFSFLDPVFSSGVYLALYSGVMVADAAHEALERGDCSAASFRDYGERFCTSIESIRRLVHAFYDVDFHFNEFFTLHPQYRGDMTDCLLGNLERDYSEFFSAISKYAKIPAPLSHGGPSA
jgi:flavin-dependent dehydrogenase